MDIGHPKWAVGLEEVFDGVQDGVDGFSGRRSGGCIAGDFWKPRVRARCLAIKASYLTSE